MTKMMRPCLALSLIALAAAQTPAPAPVTPVCAWHGIAVGDQLMNSIIYIWQGTKRCGTPHKASECSVDVSFAIQAVQNMINMIMHSIHGCGAMLENPREDCALAWGELTAGMAGVAGVSSEIADVCPKDALETVASKSQPFPHGLAECIIDAKSLFWSLFRAGVMSADASDKCTGCKAGVACTDACTDAILRATAAFASMGEFVAGIVGYCTKPDDPAVNQKAAKCSNAVIGLLHQLTNLGKGGHHLANACDVTDAQRLYLDNGGHKGLEKTKSNVPTLALALLPVTAVMSFVLGRRMSQARQPKLDEENGSQE